MDAAQLAQRTLDYHTEVKSRLADTHESVQENSARLRDLEQRMARRGGGGGFADSESKSLGEGLIADDGLKTFIGNGGVGHYRFKYERKTITSADASGGAAASPDRRTDIILRPTPKLVVRNLLTQAQTTGNLVQVPRELAFTNAATFVAEGALKPFSELTLELLEARVRTIAHLMAASKQILEDGPQLQTTVDTKMRAGLAVVEEYALLLGDGVGENLLGLTQQATAYNTALNAAGDTMTDTILRAISQCESASQLPVDGIVINSTDWSAMIGSKDGDGRYLSGGPFGQTAPTLWGRPVVDTPNMPAGKFLVGSFRQAATIYDRIGVEVLISREHADFFQRNLIALRCEERIALVVGKPWALVFGTYPA